MGYPGRLVRARKGEDRESEGPSAPLSSIGSTTWVQRWNGCERRGWVGPRAGGQDPRPVGGQRAPLPLRTPAPSRHRFRGRGAWRRCLLGLVVRSGRRTGEPAWAPFRPRCGNWAWGKITPAHSRPAALEGRGGGEWNTTGCGGKRALGGRARGG